MTKILWGRDELKALGSASYKLLLALHHMARLGADFHKYAFYSYIA